MQRRTKPAAVKPDIILTRDLSNLTDVYHDESDDSTYHNTWSNAMSKGKLGKPLNYKHVFALLLYWDKSCGDLCTEQEVNALKQVLETVLHYHAKLVPLKAAGKGKKLQPILNAIVASFIAECDGPDTLFVIYYAGHGKQGAKYGQLDLLGEISSNEKENGREYQDRVVMWNRTESLLKDAAADVFEIFDCCYAGTLGLTRGEMRRFEYLAATDCSDTTAIPGNTSFTSALIFALSALAYEKEEGRFTTVELLDKIKGAPGFPKHQVPVLSDREKNTSAGRIMLHPLRVESPSSPRPPLSPGLDGKTVTFLMDFSRKPSTEDIEKLGEAMNTMFEFHNFGVLSVRWGGMKPDTSARCVRKFQDVLKKIRRASGTQLQADVGLCDDSARHSSEESPALLTPLELSAPSTPFPILPQMHDFIATGEEHLDHTALETLSLTDSIRPREDNPDPGPDYLGITHGRFC